MTEQVEYEKKWCKYEFSAEELRDIAEKLAIKTQELEQVEDEKKAVMSSYKERIERIQSEAKKAASLYKDGYEMRDIECIVERDLGMGEVRYIRTDTGQVALTQKMTMAERQKRIDELPEISQSEDEDIAREMAIAATQRTMASETSAL